MESIACVVVPDTATPEELLEDQLIENCVREDLKPVEQARAYRTLMDRLGLSQRALAEKLSVSQGQVMQALKLLELPSAVQESIDAGEVPPSVGYEIAKIADPVRQVEMAGKVARGEAGRDDIREQTVKAPRPKHGAARSTTGRRSSSRSRARRSIPRRPSSGSRRPSSGQGRGREVEERRGLSRGRGWAVAPCAADRPPRA